MNDLLLIGAGLIALLVGAELLVRGGSLLARRLGVSPIVIGLTIVAVGTSAPELAVGVNAATVGAGDLAFGNIIGTNIVNLLLILGLSALMRPLPLQQTTRRFDLPMMAVAAGVLVLLSVDRNLSTLDGVLLLAVAAGYTIRLLIVSRRESKALVREFEREYPSPRNPRDIRGASLETAALLGGIVIIVLGAEWLVRGAVSFARAAGISDVVIGLTIVAIGTSAPEFMSTIVSTIRNERDIAVGNLIGSSVYNIALILGATALAAAPDGVVIADPYALVDLLILVGVVLLCVPVFLSGRRLSRLEGGIFVLLYAGYLTWLMTTRT